MQILTTRLEMVFEQVKRAMNSKPGRIIDVGSDHGYLGVRCLEEGVADYAICTEIHKAPAKRSEEALADAGFADRSEVHVTDGLIGVPLQEGDVIVMAGMGGLNIIDIIKQAMVDNAPEVFTRVTFILQPQKSNETVRFFLAETGFLYEDECVCCDRNIFYNSMRVIFNGIENKISDLEACYGPLLIRKSEDGDTLVNSYFDHLDEIFEVRKRSNMVIKSALEERKHNEGQ